MVKCFACYYYFINLINYFKPFLRRTCLIFKEKLVYSVYLYDLYLTSSRRKGRRNYFSKSVFRYVYAKTNTPNINSEYIYIFIDGLVFRFRFLQTELFKKKPSFNIKCNIGIKVYSVFSINKLFPTSIEK